MLHEEDLVGSSDAGTGRIQRSEVTTDDRSALVRFGPTRIQNQHQIAASHPHPRVLPFPHMGPSSDQGSARHRWPASCVKPCENLGTPHLARIAGLAVQRRTAASYTSVTPPVAFQRT